MLVAPVSKNKSTIPIVPLGSSINNNSNKEITTDSNTENEDNNKLKAVSSSLELFSAPSTPKRGGSSYNIFNQNVHMHAGIIPRCVQDIFTQLDDMINNAAVTSNSNSNSVSDGNVNVPSALSNTMNFSVTCSFLQIYNEKIFDLLQDKMRTNPLQLRESMSSSLSNLDMSTLSKDIVHVRVKLFVMMVNV